MGISTCPHGNRVYNCYSGVLGEWKLFMSFRRIALAGLTLLAVFTNGSPAVFAKKQSKNTGTQQTSTTDSTASLVSIPIEADKLDPQISALLFQIARKPELMTVDFISFYLGAPDPHTTIMRERSQAFHWYDKMRNKRCELYQEHDGTSNMVQSVLLVHLPPNQLNFDLLEKRLGMPLRRFYDQDAHPNYMYSFAPRTTTCMTSPDNTFTITKATVTYVGPVLPQPSAADMKIAHDYFLSRTYTADHSKANWQEALFKARERIAQHPNEAESHVLLAQALKKTGNVHDAISEYKYALELGKFNPAVRQQCIEGLKHLKVLPQTYTENAATGIAARELDAGF